MRSWVWVGTFACVLSACDGQNVTRTDATGSAGKAPIGPRLDEPSSPSGGSTGSISIAPAGAGGAGDETAGTGGDGGADAAPDLAYVSQLFGFDCPAEVCTGTVAASDCAALPSGVVRTEEASCDGNDGEFDRMRTLWFEFSATRRKACYYAQASFEGPSMLVGAEAWDDKRDLFDGTKSHGGAGIFPTRNCRYPSGPSTLCDLENPAQNPALNPGVPARGCFDGFSGTCEPCCDDANGQHPDCTGKPEGYPGFACTPHANNGQISYCSCSCEAERWSCAC